MVEPTLTGRSPGQRADLSYLSPKFHSWLLDVVKERFEKEANHALGLTRAMERAEAKLRKMGWSEQGISIRQQSINVQLWTRKYLD